MYRGKSWQHVVCCEARRVLPFYRESVQAEEGRLRILRWACGCREAEARNAIAKGGATAEGRGQWRRGIKP